jgi:hypothetical protein
MSAAAKLNECYAIQLTTDWLKRFGFIQEPDSHVNDWRLKKIGSSDFCLWESENLTLVGFVWWLEGGGPIPDIFPSRNNIVFVHELQNLYFAVTGEELTLKQSV